MITVPSHDGNTCPGNIHNPGQVPHGARSASLVGARCSFQSAERRATVAVYGGVPFISVSGDLRDSRGITGATEQPVQIVAPNFCGGFKVPRNLLPRINSFQEPLRGLSKCFEILLRFFAHDEQETTGAKVWRTQSKGISNP